MAKQRYINTKFWEDNYIIDLDANEKLLFLYFITNEKVDLCWIYEIHLKKIIMETWMDKDTIKKILDKFTADKKIYYIDWYIYIRNFKKNQSINPKIEEWIKRSLWNIPSDILVKVSQLDSLYIGYDSLSYFNLTKLNLTKPKLNLTDNIDIIKKTEKECSVSAETQTSKAIVPIEWNTDMRKKEVVSVIEFIKSIVSESWQAYKAGKYEYERAKNILTWKDIDWLCKRIGQTREEFISNIFYTANMLPFWRWKIYNAETFYKHYAVVYNEAASLKNTTVI